LFAKTFGYGTIEISTAGSSGVEMRFVSVSQPKKVQEMINKRIKEDKSGGEGVSQKQLLEQILSELKEINEKL
jgi:hypothetical protein